MFILSKLSPFVARAGFAEGLIVLSGFTARFLDHTLAIRYRAMAIKLACCSGKKFITAIVFVVCRSLLHDTFLSLAAALPVHSWRSNCVDTQKRSSKLSSTVRKGDVGGGEDES